MRITAIPLQSRTHRLSHFLTRSEAGCHAQHQQDHISSAVQPASLLTGSVLFTTDCHARGDGSDLARGCHAATKKPHTLPHVHANVRLRLRLLLVASGVSARNYLSVMKCFVEPLV